jgi:DNA-binding LacI/PurR family transcriptional regulator
MIKNMAEFAQVSGLSRPTISKYFSDPTSVRKATREKIEQALLVHDYRPNLFAVNLNKKTTNIIGVVVPDMADPLYSSLVRHIELNCAANGYLVIALSSRGDPRLEARCVDTLLSLKIAGAIIAPLGITSDRAMIQSLRARIPIVFLDSRLDEASPFVGTDNFQSMALITDYLCRTGGRPTFLDLPPINNNTEERRLAYTGTMARLGLEPLILTLPQARNRRFEDIGHAETLRILDGPGFPTDTVLCGNDRLAVGVMAAAWQRGLKIGRDPGCDLRIAGHDDQPGSRYCCPPLTTVAQDVPQLGSHCVDILLARLDGADAAVEPVQIRLEARLMMRASA